MGGASCMLARAARGAFLGIVVAQPRWAGGGRTVGRAGGRAGGAGRAAVVAHCFGWPYVVWASYWLLPFFSSLFVAIVLVGVPTRACLFLGFPDSGRAGGPPSRSVAGGGGGPRVDLLAPAARPPPPNRRLACRCPHAARAGAPPMDGTRVALSGPPTAGWEISGTVSEPPHLRSPPQAVVAVPRAAAAAAATTTAVRRYRASRAPCPRRVLHASHHPDGRPLPSPQLFDTGRPRYTWG